MFQNRNKARAGKKRASAKAVSSDEEEEPPRAVARTAKIKSLTSFDTEEGNDTNTKIKRKKTKVKTDSSGKPIFKDTQSSVPKPPNSTGATYTQEDLAMLRAGTTITR
eukprot:gene20566-7527_t